MAYKFLTVKEVAGLCHCSVWAVRAWIMHGDLQACRMPGRSPTRGLLLIRDDWLTAWQVEHWPPIPGRRPRGA